MKRTAIFLLLCQSMLAGSYYLGPDYWIRDQFESGYVWLWHDISSNGTGQISMSADANSGLWSMKASVGAGDKAMVTIYTNYTTPFWQSTNLYTRFYFKLNSVGANNGDTVMLSFVGNTGIGELTQTALYRTGGNLKLYSKDGTAGTTTITTGAWHCVESLRIKGSGSGKYLAWLDDVLEINETTRTDTADATAVGLGANYIVGGPWEILFDDFMVSSNYIGAEPMFRFYTADFNGRIGQRFLMVNGPGVSAGDLLRVDLLGATGSTSNRLFYGAWTNDAMLKLPTLSLATNLYTFNFTLFSSVGAYKTNYSANWNKLYAGNPSYSVDEENRLCTNGIPYFPVTDFGNAEALVNMTNWWTNGWCSDFYGEGWLEAWTNPPPDSVGVSNLFTRLGICSNWGTYFSGPTSTWFDSGLPMTNVGSSNIMSYVTNFWDAGALAYFDWIDEPENQGVSWRGELLRTAYELVKSNAPSKLVHLNTMGDLFKTNIASQSFHIQALGFSYPRQIADVLSTDIYPTEHPEFVFGYREILSASDGQKMCNYDLFPILAYIAPARLFIASTYNPSAKHLAMESWLCIAGGIRGIHWYPYEVMPDENWPVMSNFVWAVAQPGIKDAILGRDAGYKATSSTNVIARRYLGASGTNYLVVVNSVSNAISATVSSAASNAASIYGMNHPRTVTGNGSVLSVSLDPLEYVVLSESGAYAPTRAANAVTVHAGTMTQPAP